MKHKRARAIIVHEGRVLLMYRLNGGREYYVFPGGGIERGEDPTDAVVREVREETTVEVEVVRSLYHVHWTSGAEEYFYLCVYCSGNPSLPQDSEEYGRSEDGSQYFRPLWVTVEDMSDMTLYPLEIRDRFLKDFSEGFQSTIQEFALANPS